jgi:hypothetical protein
MSVSATADGIASKTIAKQPGGLELERPAGDPARRGGIPALRLVAAQGGRGLRGEADVPHDRDPGLRDRLGPGDRRRAAALELDRRRSRPP